MGMISLKLVRMLFDMYYLLKRKFHREKPYVHLRILDQGSPEPSSLWLRAVFFARLP